MFNYKAYKRYEKARKKSQPQPQPKKLLFIPHENKLLSCWRFETGYEKVDGVKLYNSWARGEGEVARHLCSDGRCVNPLHLIRGSWLENAEDEVKVRDFENRLMMEMLGDWSMKDKDPGLAHLSMLPRINAMLSKDRGMKTLSETASYLREYYREDFVKNLIENQHLIPAEMLEDANKRLLFLLMRNDINIIFTGKGGLNNGQELGR